MTVPLMPLEDDSAIGSEHENVDNAAIELAAKWNGLSCEKCSAPMKSDTVSICRHCGWYGSLGQFVEVDRDWEACCGDDVKPTAPQVAPSHAQVWLNLLPRWAWIMIASSTAVVVESIVVRLATPEDSAFRTNWSLTQLVVGFIAFVSAHFLNFLFAIADDADTGVIDFLLRPLKLWMKAFRNLPSRLWVANTASTGYVAAVMSIVVIGGLPYDRLWDWGFKQPPQQNLLSAVMKQAQQIEGSGDKDMEEAMKDFAGQAGADGLGTGDKKPTPAKRLTASFWDTVSEPAESCNRWFLALPIRTSWFSPAPWRQNSAKKSRPACSRCSLIPSLRRRTSRRCRTPSGLCRSFPAACRTKARTSTADW
jgi:hypothetical protein